MNQTANKSGVITPATHLPAIVNEIEVVSTGTPFIEANTIESSLTEIKGGHIIPVFLKDNEPVISHAEFIETALSATMEVYHGETVLRPSIRLSHPIKGRTPDAKYKPASALSEAEKTIYYERMAFIIEIPTICHDIDGSKLSLMVGGVKAYNLDNLYNKSGADQHFKVFVGFKNKVCCNLCISTDGYLENLKVKNIDMLRHAIKGMLQDFDAVHMAVSLEQFRTGFLTEQQFALLIGRCRMYRYLPDEKRRNIPELLFGESHLNTICNDYFRDMNFSRDTDGKLSLWNLYNLFTGANKNSYIDTFADRSVNAFKLITTLNDALEQKEDCWFLQ